MIIRLLINAVLSSDLFLNHQFLKIGVVVCFSFFLSLCACVIIVFCVFMGFEPATEDK